MGMPGLVQALLAVKGLLGEEPAVLQQMALHPEHGSRQLGLGLHMRKEARSALQRQQACPCSSPLPLVYPSPQCQS